jgi:hypothetical protein
LQAGRSRSSPPSGVSREWFDYSTSKLNKRVFGRSPRFFITKERCEANVDVSLDSSFDEPPRGKIRMKKQKNGTEASGTKKHQRLGSISEIRVIYEVPLLVKRTGIGICKVDAVSAVINDKRTARLLY